MPAHIHSDPEPSLHYQDEFRLAWEAIPDPPSLIQPQPGANIAVLRKLISLQRSIIERQDSGADVRADMQLLDNKLNMVLDLLGDLYQSLHQLPAHVPVDLCSTAIAWSAAEPPGSDDRLILKLYLSDHYPRPLVLKARVVTVDQSLRPCRVSASFEDMDAATRDELERLIFLLHRQSIARSRQS